MLVGARDGTAIVNVLPNGTEDLNSTVIPRGPFGTLEGGGAAGNTDAETGFAGASTPNQTGGFEYLRNRWYDPKTEVSDQSTDYTDDADGVFGVSTNRRYSRLGAPKLINSPRLRPLTLR